MVKGLRNGASLDKRKAQKVDMSGSGGSMDGR